MRDIAYVLSPVALALQIHFQKQSFEWVWWTWVYNFALLKKRCAMFSIIECVNLPKRMILKLAKMGFLRSSLFCKQSGIKKDCNEFLSYVLMYFIFYLKSANLYEKICRYTGKGFLLRFIYFKDILNY